MNIIQKFQAYLALSAKISEADAKHKVDGKRYFVTPVHGTLQAINIEEALSLKKQGALPADLTNKTIYGASYYWSDTTAPHTAAPGPMPKFERNRRRAYYYRWFEAHHTHRK